MFNLIPTLLSVFIALSLMPIAVHWLDSGAAKTQAYTAASQERALVDAIKSYVRDNYQAIVTATAGGPQTTPLSALQAAGYLSPSVSIANPYGQQWSMAIYQPSTGVLEVLATTSGGREIAQDMIASIAAQVGQEGGFEPHSAGPYAASAGDAIGSYGGWKVPVSSFGLTPAPGHLAAFLYYKNGAQSSDYLYRVQVPGQPQLNTMETDLSLGGHDIASAGNITAQTEQLAPGNALKIGGNYLYGDASNAAIRTSGSFYIQTQNGSSAADIAEVKNVQSSGTVSAVNLSTGANGLWANSSGNTWVNSLFQRGALIAKATATLGSSCSVPGGWSTMAAGDSAGDLLVCKSGTWQKLGGGGNQLITKKNFLSLFAGHTASDPRTGALMFYIASDGTLFDNPSISGNTVTWTHIECNLLQTGTCVPGDVAGYNNNRDYWANLNGISWTVTWGNSTDESTRFFAMWDDPIRVSGCGWRSVVIRVFTGYTYRREPFYVTLPPPWVDEGRVDRRYREWRRPNYSTTQAPRFQCNV
jgi:hypothetical protein